LNRIEEAQMRQVLVGNPKSDGMSRNTYVIGLQARAADAFVFTIPLTPPPFVSGRIHRFPSNKRAARPGHLCPGDSPPIPLRT
jgi:hypothetical protein